MLLWPLLLLLITIGNLADQLQASVAKAIQGGSDPRSEEAGKNNKLIRKRWETNENLPDCRFLAGSLPEHFDWRDYGKVTEPKDQQRCNSCYAFAVVATIESAMAIQYGLNVSASTSTGHHKDIDLSEQELVDCSKGGEFYNRGCSFGFIAEGFRFVKLRGLVAESVYPYIANETSSCQRSPDVGRVYIQSYVSLNPTDFELVKSIIYCRGPVATNLFATDKQFKSYKGGVIGNPKRNSRPDHAITLIGWGMSHKQREYFIVKNSWGPDWGVDGFGLVEFGARGICESVSFPIVKGPYQASLDHFNNVAFFVFMVIMLAFIFASYTVLSFWLFHSRKLEAVISGGSVTGENIQSKFKA